MIMNDIFIYEIFSKDLKCSCLLVSEKAGNCLHMWTMTMYTNNRCKHHLALQAELTYLRNIFWSFEVTAGSSSTCLAFHSLFWSSSPLYILPGNLSWSQNETRNVWISTQYGFSEIIWGLTGLMVTGLKRMEQRQNQQKFIYFKKVPPPGQDIRKHLLFEYLSKIY